jgi:hypothetical protein
MDEKYVGFKVRRAPSFAFIGSHVLHLFCPIQDGVMLGVVLEHCRALFGTALKTL